MKNAQGFWSYVRDDDKAERGRISQLAKDVVSQYEMLLGEKISLFLDNISIAWGENWRDRINESLLSVAFFIPVLTPRYFMSPECRRELQVFAQRATAIGIKELILPLYYVTVPVIDNKIADDDLIELIRNFQWEDWRDIRFLDVESEGYRRGVAKLANRLVGANRRAEEVAAALAAQEVEASEESEEEEPGIIDKLASYEESLRKWPETIKALTDNAVQIGNIMRESTEDINRSDSQDKGFTYRIIIARQMASKLGEPADNIWKLGKDFIFQLHNIDDGIRIIVERAPKELIEQPEARPHLIKFFQSVRELTSAWFIALKATQEMISKIEPLESISRDLRPVLRKLRQGLTNLVESKVIVEEWVNLIQKTGMIG